MTATLQALIEAARELSPPEQVELIDAMTEFLRHGDGHVRARCRAAGKPISPQDAWIAATALQRHIPLVTHNPADFRAIRDLMNITTV